MGICTPNFIKIRWSAADIHI